MKRIFLSLLFALLVSHLSSQNLINPSFEQVISLRNVSNAKISPDGKNIVFESRVTDWLENRYDTELWLSKDRDEPFQITNNPKGSSSNAKWSPDGKWIAFLSNRNDKSQIFVLRVDGGEAFAVHYSDSNIFNFDWSPNGKQIAFLQSEDSSEANKKREEKFGAYVVEDVEYDQHQLWLTDFDPNTLNSIPLPEQIKDSAYKASLKPTLLLGDSSYSINTFKWSPDGKMIAFEHQPNPLRNTFFKADIGIYDLETKTQKDLVTNKSYDGLVDWSPDGKSILYQTSLSDSISNYYKNGKLFRIDIDGGNNKQLAKDFDEEVSNISWNPMGIFASVWQKTDRSILHIDPISGKFDLVNTDCHLIRDFSFSEDGKHLSFTGGFDNTLLEIFEASYPIKNTTQITNVTDQIEHWAVSDSEVIRWKSKDGQQIEGVLHKPMDYDPNKKYPLLVVIHGGPTGISFPQPTPSYVYPMVQWLNKGALILQPNYRGSAGYGEKFRSLNVRNLGVGDAWDVLSGVKYLEDKGMIDGAKVASMGWSQGGYISAFLTTNSNKFKAISVGAGISNWMTYYVNTDIHPFTRQYLKATPWSDPEIYKKTSPITNINKASTPTLIQHGEFDRRVPIANAYELFQGLQDNSVETKLVVYKGFGHGINKPKEVLAATWHNWQWFGKHIWGEDISLPED